MFSRIANTTRLKYATVALTVMLVPLFNMLFLATTSAAELTARSVRVGTSEAGATTSHTFRFRVNTAITVGSLEFEYCTNSPYVGDVCTAPTGFLLDDSSMGTQSGLTGFGIHPSTTSNKLILGRTPAGVAPPVNAVIRIDNIHNPTTPTETVFVRISTYATNNGTGIRGDRGTVVFSTARGVNVSGYVPPYLTFCIGVTVTTNCATTVGNYLDFGEFSTAQAKAVTSQFGVATNDPSGYVTAISGLTLTSGNNTIPALETPQPSRPGTSQFGVNLRANSVPGVGSDRSGAGTGAPTAAYNISNAFAFIPGTLAGSSIPTEFNIFTVSYVANISPDQPAGVYISTLTYITTVSF